MFEKILDKRPKLSFLPRKYRIYLLPVLLEIAWITLAVYTSLSMESILLGSLIVVAVALWRRIAVHIRSEVERLGRPSPPLERKVIDEYKRTLISGYEPLISLIPFLFIFYHLVLSSNASIGKWLGREPDPTLVFFIGVLLWNVVCEMGLSLWISLKSLNRSIRFSKASKARFQLDYTHHRELHALKRLDMLNIYFLIGVIPIFPIWMEDEVLLWCIIAYSTSILGTSLSSWMTMDGIPIYPPEAIWLLEEGMFAYLGTSSLNRQPHVTPTIFVFDGKTPYAVTSKFSRKVKNLKKNSRAALLIDVRDPMNLENNRAVLIKGEAKIFGLSDAIIHLPNLVKLRRLFHKKYPHYMRKYSEERGALPIAWRTTLFISRVIIRIDMREFTYWRRATQVYVPT